MLVFSVYIPSLISRVRPVHSFFEKKSILENTSQIFTNLFFNAYKKSNLLHNNKEINTNEPRRQQYGLASGHITLYRKRINPQGRT